MKSIISKFKHFCRSYFDKNSIEYEIRKLLNKKCIDNNLKPIKCQFCGSIHLDEIIIDSIDYVPCEKKIVCMQCKKMVGYWAYGNYLP